MGLSFYTRNPENHLLILPVQKTTENIIIKIPRPSTKIPTWKHFYPIPHEDTGMSYHGVNVTYNDTSLTIQIQADETDVRYAVFLKYEVPPTVDEYDSVFVMPESFTSVQGKIDHKGHAAVTKRHQRPDEILIFALHPHPGNHQSYSDICSIRALPEKIFCLSPKTTVTANNPRFTVIFFFFFFFFFFCAFQQLEICTKPTFTITPTYYDSVTNSSRMSLCQIFRQRMLF